MVRGCVAVVIDFHSGEVAWWVSGANPLFKAHVVYVPPYSAVGPKCGGLCAPLLCSKQRGASIPEVDVELAFEMREGEPMSVAAEAEQAGGLS